jgi:predicted permease
LLICVGAALISGLTPVLHAIRPNVAESLKESGRSNTADGASHRLRSAFVVSEVALALVALVGAGLFLRSFDHARSVDPGFNPDNVLVSRFALSMNGYSPEQRQQFCLRLQQRLESAPGVAAVSYTDTIPLGLGLGAGTEFEVEGYLPHPGENTEIDRSLIGPRYFELMETPLVEGREFTHHDDGHSAPVAIVNEAFVERYFSGGQPLDRRIRAFGKWFRVVGVARNSKYYYFDEAPRPYLFLPVRQTEVPSSGVGIAFFVRAAAVDALDTIRREAAAIDPNVGALDSMPLAEYISGRLFPQKIAATLLSVLGVMALLLVAVGLYGVMAYAVSQRVHEIGIRVALGARPLDVVGLIVRKGLVLTGVGVAVGVVAALAASRIVSGMLVDVSATDPAIFAGAVLFLGVVAVTASYLPARRATRVDPVKALRGR